VLLVKLNAKAFGLACGILWGLVIFVATFWVMIKGGGNTLALLQQFYFGYKISVLGAFIGLVWGFIDGFIGGYLFSWLYNRLSKE
jgi:hypothetical protein